MTPMKNRKTPLQSKHDVVVMMELFESKVDEKIISINLDHKTITTTHCDYAVDIHKNTVERVYPDPED